MRNDQHKQNPGQKKSSQRSQPTQQPLQGKQAGGAQNQQSRQQKSDKQQPGDFDRDIQEGGPSQR